MAELSRLKLFDGSGQHNASVVDERVETTPLLEHPIAEPSHRIIIGDITLHRVERKLRTT